MINCKEQIESLLSCISKRSPKLRICQIMVIAAKKGGWNQDDIFYCPDDILLKGLQILSDEAQK